MLGRWENAGESLVNFGVKANFEIDFSSISLHGWGDGYLGGTCNTVFNAF